MYSAQDTNLFVMTTQIFDDNSSNFVHLGEWSDPRRDAHQQHPRSQLPGVVDLCEVRHDLGDCQLFIFSDRCQVACLRVARGCISLKSPLCLANHLGSYLWKLSALHNLINKYVVLDIDHCAFGSHWRKATRLVPEDSLTVLVFTVYISAGSDATESTGFL